MEAVCYLQVNHSDCRGCSSASAGRENRAVMVAGRRKMAWDGFAAVHCQRRLLVCFHLQEAKVSSKHALTSNSMKIYTFSAIQRGFYPPFFVSLVQNQPVRSKILSAQNNLKARFTAKSLINTHK